MSMRQQQTYAWASSPTCVEVRAGVLTLSTWVLFLGMTLLFPASAAEGLPVQPETLLSVVLLTAQALERHRISQDIRWIATRSLAVPALALLSLLIVRDLAAGEASLVLRWLACGLAFTTAAISGRTPEGRKAFQLVTAAAAVVYVPWLKLSGWNLQDLEVTVGPWTHRTVLAYATALGLIGWYATANERREAASYCLALAIAAVLSVTILSLSGRGAWLAAFFATIFFLGVWRTLGAGTILFCILLLLGGSVLPADLATRMYSLTSWEGSSNGYRLDMYKAAVAFLSSGSPLGVPPSQVTAAIDAYSGYQYSHFAMGERVIDGDLVWLAFRTGLTGCFLYLLIMGILASIAVRLIAGRQSGSMYQVSALVVLLLVWSVFDNLLETPFGWLLLGYAVANIYGLRRLTGPRFHEIARPAVVQSNASARKRSPG